MSLRIFLITSIFLFFATGTAAETNTSSNCPYPAHPVNWILSYCGFAAGTDDEITIQLSYCYKKAALDLEDKKNSCAIKKKYKALKCGLLMKQQLVKHQNIEECLKADTVKPFFAGSN